MKRRPKTEQLYLPFWEGEARTDKQVASKRLVSKPETPGPDVPPPTLMEEICCDDNIKRALDRVVSNRGSSGVDGMSVQALREKFSSHWPSIRDQLLSGAYRPSPVRAAEIPKLDGGIRVLGVPTVWDRLVQQAMAQVLSPLFDPAFSEHSYGFRPGKNAQQAVTQAQAYVRAGQTWVVDIDLEKFFDRVNHDLVMARLMRRVRDTRVLRLTRKFLQAGLMSGGVVSVRVQGTPQGGPLSPLLSNILLDSLDQELTQRGLRFVRYADDCNIYVASKKAAKRVMASISRFTERKLKLQINVGKSAVDRPWKRDFLGFTLTMRPSNKLRINPKAMKRAKDKLREMTRRVRGASLGTVVQEVSVYLQGWGAYFTHCETPTVLRDLDSWLRHRLRTLVWAQWRNNRNRVNKLLGLGPRTKEHRERVFFAIKSRPGPWRAGNLDVMRQTLSPGWFAKLGLHSLLNQHKTRRVSV